MADCEIRLTDEGCGEIGLGFGFDDWTLMIFCQRKATCCCAISDGAEAAIDEDLLTKRVSVRRQNRFWRAIETARVSDDRGSERMQNQGLPIGFVPILGKLESRHVFYLQSSRLNQKVTCCGVVTVEGIIIEII